MNIVRAGGTGRDEADAGGSAFGGVLTLAIDASAPVGTVAVLRGSAVVAEGEALMRGEFEERLMPAIAATLARAGCIVRDVAQVVCGAGPGSFTSLRIAAAIAKGIAVGNSAVVRETPLFAVSSLALIVAGHQPPLSAGRYLALLDAMRGERYAALFEVAADGSIGKPDRRSPNRIAEADVSAACERFGAVAIGPRERLAALPLARGVGRMLDDIVAAGPVPLDAWEPDYGRLAEAQVRWEAAHGRPLAPGPRVRHDALHDVRVRIASERDLDCIHAIEVASFRDPWSLAGFRDVLHNSLARLEVAESADGAVVGYAVAWFVADESEIANLAVAKDARRRGIGARLLDGILDAAASFGARSVFLEVRESNHAGRQLYASRGFEVAGRRTTYYHTPDEDALIMRRAL